MRTILFCCIAAFTFGSFATTASAQFGIFGSSPQVKEISTAELRRLQTEQKKAEEQAEQAGKTPPAADFVIVDVRSPEEYRVSTIPGAITKSKYESNVKAYAGKTVIPYCTVGARSGRYARQLAAKGVKVVNYKDSIIGWCTNKLPLTGPDGKPTNAVHTVSPRYKVPSSYKAVY